MTNRIIRVLLYIVLILALSYIIYHRLIFPSSSQQYVQPSTDDTISQSSNKPSPQDIAASMNTFWDDWDEDHCKNICEASWTACRLRQCHGVPGVRTPDEL
ncbi:hypothetical protein DE146DRAFT_326880 [Phaeosphaeria sp. MPI-PUGE-AT-0046c]|nr:hypothetical protein DE146DRAFT_326880 [Phaeosphaeria sp. MPI-PUGE-AT-0046c]